MADDLPGAQPVPLGDLEIADRIAQAARSGRPVDRAPTLGQLLAAFAEPEPTEAARRRVGAALAMADVATRPDVMDAAPEDRVFLKVAGSGPPVRRIAIGVGALVAVIGGAALAATIGGDDKGNRASDQLPLETTQTRPPVPVTPPTTTTPTQPTTTQTQTQTTTTQTTPTTPVATVTTPAATGTTTVGTTSTSTTPRAAPKKPPRRPRKRRGVSVLLRPSQPTFLCAKDRTGRVLFAGTLSSPRRFRASRILINVGIGPTTRVLVNGKPLVLTSSPAGYDITRTKRVPLGTGARPEC